MCPAIDSLSDARDAEGTQQIISVLAGLVVGAVTAAILIPIVQPRQPAGSAGVIAKAVAASLAVAAMTVGAVWLASFIAGIQSDRRLRSSVAFTSVWFTPLLIFGGQRSWAVLAIWAAISIQFVGLGVLLSNIRPTDTAPEVRTPYPIPYFEGLRGQTVARDALVASFFAQAGLCAVVAWRLALAEALFLVAAIAFSRRGWRMVRDSPLPQKPPVSPSTFRALALVPTLLMIFAWLPRMARHGTGEPGSSGNLGYAAESNRAPRRELAQPETSSILDRVFPGVVLYPVVKSSMRLIAPPLHVARGIPGATNRPFQIPFDGVYWFWRPPAEHPPESAVVKEGSPAKLIFRSTDGSPLWMEAHQNIGSDTPPKSSPPTKCLTKKANPPNQ